MHYIKSENDFYTTLERAMDEIEPKWRNLKGVMVLGSHMPDNIEEKLALIKNARINKIPFLGICMGFQLAIIEYARNVLEMPLANSREIKETGIIPVVEKLPELRVGTYPVEWKGGEMTLESHWHNFSFNKNFHDNFKDKFWISYTGDVAEIMELREHPFFVGIQFHCEYESRKDKPHKLLKGFINACKAKTNNLL